MQKQQSDEKVIFQLVSKTRKRMPRIGGKKIYCLIKEELNASGIKLGRDKLFDFLKEKKLLVQRKKRYHITTNSHHMFKKYPNLIKELPIYRRDQVWVSDITYMKTDEGFSYAAMITDAFSKKIVGRAIAQTMTAQLTVQALKQAIGERNDLTGLIHHSDRGLQYCCREYTNILEGSGVKISMTENSDPYENALAERMNRTIKEEFILEEKIRSFEELEILFIEGVDIYNTERPHLSLNMRTPDEIYSQN